MDRCYIFTQIYSKMRLLEEISCDGFVTMGMEVATESGTDPFHLVTDYTSAISET